MNIGGVLDETVTFDPRHMALSEPDREVSYGELLELVQRTAGAFRDAGVSPGDCVAMMLPNGIDFAVAYFATLRLGAVAVSVNYMNRQYELGHILAVTHPKVLVTQERTCEAVAPALENAETRALLTDGPDGDEASLSHWVAKAAPAIDVEPRQPSDPAVVIFTSAHDGGHPRGATITHGNLDFASRCAIYECALNRRSTHLGALPFFHSYGQTNTLLCTLRAGGSVACMPRFSAGLAGELAKRYEATHFAVVPTMVVMLIASGDIDDDMFKNFSHFTSGGAHLPGEALQGFEARFNFPVQEGYGLTEAAPTVSYTRLEYLKRPGSVGQVMPRTEMRIVNEGGEPLPAGEVGEVIVKGPQVFRGYWNDDAFTAKALQDGWLHTGDLGQVDKDGMLTLTGLKKHMCLVGGFNVYPEEVETLMGHVPEVVSAEVGWDEDLIQGSLVTAKVTLKPGVKLAPRELRRKCMDVMSMYKVPRVFEIAEE